MPRWKIVTTGKFNSTTLALHETQYFDVVFRRIGSVEFGSVGNCGRRKGQGRGGGPLQVRNWCNCQCLSCSGESDITLPHPNAHLAHGNGNELASVPRSTAVVSPPRCAREGLRARGRTFFFAFAVTVILFGVGVIILRTLTKISKLCTSRDKKKKKFNAYIDIVLARLLPSYRR